MPLLDGLLAERMPAISLVSILAQWLATFGEDIELVGNALQADESEFAAPAHQWPPIDLSFTLNLEPPLTLHTS